MIALSVVVVLLAFGMIGAWLELFSLTQRHVQLREVVQSILEHRAGDRVSEQFSAVPPPKTEAEKLEGYKRRLMVALGEDPSNPDSVDPLVLVETMRNQFLQLLDGAAKNVLADAGVEKPKRKRKPRAAPQPVEPQQVVLGEAIAKSFEAAKSFVDAPAAEETPGGVA